MTTALRKRESAGATTHARDRLAGNLLVPHAAALSRRHGDDRRAGFALPSLGHLRHNVGD